jgi:molybdopterin biosynthesis enzyme
MKPCTMQKGWVKTLYMYMGIKTPCQINIRMKIGIISVGSELVCGQTKDLNAPFMASKLTEIGLDIKCLIREKKDALG